MNLNTLIILTVFVAVGGAEAKRLTTGKTLTLSPVLAGFMLGMLLFILGLGSEELAEDFAYLVIVGSLIINGVPIAQSLTPKKG